MQKTYIQITSGRGPEECCRVVVLVMEKLIRQAKDRNIICKLIDYEPGLRDSLKNLLYACSFVIFH